MKVKSDMLKVVKMWYSDIADLRQKHKLVIFVRDNAGKNKLQEITEFFVSLSVKTYFFLPQINNGRMDFWNQQSTQLGCCIGQS
jgi:hypothetical protein